MKTVNKLWIGIAILALLSPLGLIIPAFFHADGAWGEWSIEELRKLIGYVPEGMQRLGDIWKSPMHDYTVPGQNESMLHKSLGYIFTALAGVLATAGLGYLLTKIIARKNKQE